MPGGGADGACDSGAIGVNEHGDEEVVADEGVEHAEGNDTLGEELRSLRCTRGPRGRPQSGDDLGEADIGDDVACDDGINVVVINDLKEAEWGRRTW